MANQYFKETLNKLSTSIDLTDPNGLEMSAAFDKYVERVIKPIYPKGARIRQTSSVDDASGMRYVDWSFRDTNNKIEQAVQTAVDNFTQSWGKARGLLDDTGNPVAGAGAVPMQVSGITPQGFNGTKTRILNPRVAKSVELATILSGGDYTMDKNTGISTWSVPDTAMTAAGKGLSRSLRAEVREGDRKWLEGKVALSSLADGASPATAEERAIAMNSRNHRVMLAKYKAMTPEQERDETFLRLAQAGRRYGDEQDYERTHPTDPRVMAKRMARQKQQLSRSVNKTKQLGNRAVRLARNTVALAIGSILSAVAMGVKFLGTINAAVLEIGSNVRRQAMSDMRLNFDDGTTRAWERFAEKRGYNKELLTQAAGGIAASWSSPLNYTDSNFNALAPYLREGTVNLVRQATSSGDTNVLNIMSSVIDDLVQKSFSGIAGTKAYTGQSRMTAAFTENASALSQHNAAWGELMQDYWYEVRDSDSKFRIAAAAAGKDTGFESWLTQYTWNPEFRDNTGSGMSNQTVKTAAELTYDAVNSMKSSLNALKTDVMERIAGSTAQLVEDVRSILSNWLARYFPAFAMKEKERADYLNGQSLVAAENNLPGYKETAERGLQQLGFTGGLAAFRPIYEGIMKRDPRALDSLPAGVNLEMLDNFIRYQAPAYYETEKVVRQLNEETTKAGKDPNYVPRVIVYDPAANGTRFSSLGMAAGYGLQHIRVQQRAPNISSGSTGFWARILGGAPIDDNPDRPIYDALNWLGLGMIPDLLTGQTAGRRQAGMTAEERRNQQIGNRISGAYARYKDYLRPLDRYENVSENGVLLLSENGRLLSEMQTVAATSNFHSAEQELFDYLAGMYETGNPQFVLNAYDAMAGFYQQYGHFARTTNREDAARIRARIQSDTNGVVFGDVIAQLSSVFAPDEVVSLLRDQREKYIRLNHLEGELSNYQAAQTLPVQAMKGILTNSSAIAYDLNERVNRSLLGIPSLPDNIFDVLRKPGVQALTFDVDDEAIKNGSQVVTNVYLEVQGRSPIPLLQTHSTGLSRDVRVSPGQDVMQALLEALAPTQR